MSFLSYFNSSVLGRVIQQMSQSLMGYMIGVEYLSLGWIGGVNVAESKQISGIIPSFHTYVRFACKRA